MAVPRDSIMQAHPQRNQRRKHDSWQANLTVHRSCIIIVAEGMHSEKKFAWLLQTMLYL